MMYPGGSKNFDESTGRYRSGKMPIGKPIMAKDEMNKPPVLKKVKRRMNSPRPFQPIARDTGGITGPGGKSVNPIYNTY